MTSILKPMLFIFLVTISIASCNNEELFVEPTADTPVETTTPTDSTSTDTPTPPEDTVDPVNTTTPCDFDLSTASSGDTIIINCLMDLNGQTINLPSNVTILYEGGDITNGTLNFSDNSVISGELLNSSVTLSGSTPQLKDPTFNFDPTRWDIVQGEVSDDVAQRNRDLLVSYFEQAKALGATTFKIDTLDAYFKTDDPTVQSSEGAINVPSDFHLLMSDNTHLRQQPNNNKSTILLAVFKVSNVIIEGGFFHGDRDTHDYSDGETHEWGHSIRVGGSENVTIKGITSIDAGGDGISIGSHGHAYDTFYRPTDNLLITGCTIIRNRRNGISIGDGRNIVIENNEFIDNGVDTELSKGTAPRMAIDIEAQNNGGVVYQIAKDITIRNNTETGAAFFSFYIASGSNVTIEDNNTQGSIGFYESHDSVIRNNTIIATSNEQKTSSTGLLGGVSPTIYGNYNNKIYGNKVTGYAIGLDVVNFNNEIYDNEIINCKTGIIINELKDSSIHDNVIKSTSDRSMGIITKASTSSINNVTIKNNTIDVVLSAFKMQDVNLDNTNNSFNIINNTTKSNGGTSSFNNLSGLVFNDNINEGGFRMVGATNSTFANNTIKTNGSIGLDFSSLNDNIEVFNNAITINGTSECIRDKQDNTNLNIYNNTCN
ncbi:right-handed parallel beta-helix repeat-containing protein [Yeosuana marina]|uniref:right-handed parallel beta-helix repeat-containing protein n=1 Tax=Yeosuana marina TaxID=1565536 RepID=UPI00141E21A8|nr:right-handed parallel beta-helix repeat-containing protein [Yeosuana marina]